LAEAGFEPESFDAVVLLSVLEHVNDPRAMLADVRRVLRPSGALFVIVPNVASLACRVLHERAATFDGRNHLVYFSPETLTRILTAEGFETEFTRTRVSSLAPVLEWLTYNEPYSDVEVEPDPLVRWLGEAGHRERLEELLDELQLGYKLHCLARRTGAVRA
ncbi:MAG TPA: methyltransferase domain-containing protein, partial [Gaiellaceae bacterium]|nr:methyltransferase domain-containing protein [Gaiellaceae bacterium]